ncbi:MAG TPA: DUF167 domain-containing protein [Thermomicrobiales bacterium]|nr:DUF167 domain-containing protein [Thermomicrobiales bacterium]
MTDAETLRAVVAPSPDGCVLTLIVAPRAGKTAFAGVGPDGLRLRVAAPPVDGAANGAIVRFLADVFAVPPSRVRLIAGERGRRKRVAVAGIHADEAIAWLETLLAG